MQKYKIILTSLLLVTQIQTLKAQEMGALVVGGTPTSSTSPVSKAMMLLRINGSICSGVAISQQHVLTAGHCVDKNPTPSQIKVYQGANKVQQTAVQSYTLHSLYGWEGQRLRGDLAILKMSRPFDSNVIPAPILESSNIPTNTQILAAGFGWSNPNKTRIRELYQAIFTWNRTAYVTNGRFTDGTRLIEYTQDQAMCGGDSGGATFVNTTNGLRTVGIHSLADCVSKSFDVYVYDHRNWIKKNLTK